MTARALLRSPFATLGSALVLAAGVLALLAAYSLASQLLFRPVSARYGADLKRVVSQDARNRLSTRLSYVETRVLRETIGTGGVLAGVYLQPVAARVSGVSAQTMAEVVDGPYFQLMGMRTLHGRVLDERDQAPGAPPVAVISGSLRRFFFGDLPPAPGTVIELNRSSYTIVGVAEPVAPAHELGAVDVWVSEASADPIVERGWRTDPTKRWFSLFVLPRSVVEVDARLVDAARELARSHSEVWRDRRLRTAEGSMLVGAQRTAATRLSAVLFALASLILVTAAANVGGLLIARAAAAGRSTAIRLSLGAGRGALIRRQLMEGVGLGTLGASLAVALYVPAGRWLSEISLLPTMALRLDFGIGPGLAAGVVVAGACVGLLLAIGPAIWAMRSTSPVVLRGSSAGSGLGPRFARLRALLVSAQVCLSFALVVGATLFGRSLSALTSVDLGFERQGLVAMDFDAEPAGPVPSDPRAAARAALSRARSVPGVVAVAMSNRAPVDPSTPVVSVHLGDPAAAVSDVTLYLATSGYFETLGLPLVEGRAFTETDEARDVVIVNETLARRLWPGAAAVGRALHQEDGARLQVVGVARDSKYRTLDEAQRPHVYRPTAPGNGMTLLARSAGPPHAVLTAVQDALDRSGSGLVGFFPRSLDEHLAVQLLPTRVAAAAATAISCLAVAFCAVGLYGLVSWFVEHGRREIGVRMALGATRASIHRHVILRALASAVPGLVAGLGLALALGVGARSTLFGVDPVDPAALALGGLTLFGTVVIAGTLPACRATRVEPASIFRAD